MTKKLVTKKRMIPLATGLMLSASALAFVVPMPLLAQYYNAISSSAETQEANAFGSRLVQAADEGRLATVQMLLRRGTDVNERGKLDTTALMRAAYRGHDDVANYLLQVGADPNIRDIGGATALHLASREGKDRVVELLLMHGADPNIRDDEGWTPLMRASLSGQKPVVDILIANGANVNAANGLGETALMHAVQARSMDVVASLISRGANPAQANAAGDSAIELARRYEQPEIEQYLLAASGRVPQTSAFGYGSAQQFNEMQPASGGPIPITSSPQNVAGVQRRMPKENNMLQQWHSDQVATAAQAAQQQAVQRYAQEVTPQVRIQRIPEPAAKPAPSQEVVARIARASETQGRPEVAKPEAKLAPQQAQQTPMFKEDMRQFVDSHGVVDLEKVKDFAVARLNAIEQAEAVQVRQQLAEAERKAAQEAAMRVQQAKFEAEKQAAERIEAAKIQMAKFESHMQKVSGQQMAALVARDWQNQYLAEHQAFNAPSSAQIASVAPPPSPSAEQAQPVTQHRQAAQDIAPPVRIPQTASYAPRPPESEQPQAAVTQEQSRAAAGERLYTKTQVQALMQQAVDQVIAAKQASILKEAEEKAAQILAAAQSQAEEQLANLAPAAGNPASGNAAQVLRSHNTEPADTEYQPRVEVSRAIITPAPRDDIADDITYNVAGPTSADNTEDEDASDGQNTTGVWLEIGDFQSGREAISHFADISRRNSIRGLRPRILYPEGDREYVAIQIGPLNSYDAASRLCQYFQTDSVNCVIKNQTAFNY
ncbi:MAG: ankyrin repeat domain-containing protein [Hyphomicrobiales bacterium]|nr:ankyrin repeat domain-containing protein [Hyphomicrobiales bacterium]